MLMRTFVVLVVVCAGVGGAAVAGQDPAPALSSGASAVAVSPDAYRLAAGDGIQIRFLHNPELAEEVQIRPDGSVSLQAVGDVKVSGLTVDEVVERLDRTYRSILKNPAVTVQIRQFANNRIFVGGEVTRPGMLPLVGFQTALGAITEAGGFRGSANRDGVIVIRRGERELPHVVRLSTRPQGGEPSDVASFALQPLDVVLVPESGIARANRAVDQYVRQMIPGVLTGGFTYLFNDASLGLR
jgi:protein involved in polysaccharide export with SLBB domain